MSPVEIRDILGLKDQCMVSLGGGEISIARLDDVLGARTICERRALYRQDQRKYIQDDRSPIQSRLLKPNRRTGVSAQAKPVQRPGYVVQPQPSVIRQHLRTP